MSKTPEALQMATFIDQTYNKGYAIGCERTAKEIAAELRRLHAANTELIEALQELANSYSPLAWGSQTNKADAINEARKALEKHGSKS